MERKQQHFIARKQPKHFQNWLVLLVLYMVAIFPLKQCHGSSFDYSLALSKSLLYLEAQRSGRLPHSQRVTWRHHSGLTDGLEQGVDLVGGYYDAGDNVKFGLPMAFTITMLSWGMIQYGQEISDAGEYDHALEAIKWGTDYFIKAHTHPNVLWVEVGDGDTDHYCWQRPEEHLMDEKHKEHKDTLDQYRSKAEYYLCACLNKNNSTNVHRTPGGLLYIRQWNNMQYVSTAAFLLTIYSDHLVSTNQTLRCDRAVLAPQEVFALAKSQVDYILGSNPMAISYLVGYGANFPQRVHHRGASIASYKEDKGFIGCTQGYDNWFKRLDPNPNVVHGALVGGPDDMDQFRDERSNYVQTEACTYNSGTLVGVFAKLHRLYANDSHNGPLIASS
uniref:Endoglucanase n=1 Tax=Litchi chinensis TaxID=151069 RepID=A0A4P8NZP3_LITCN|nr:endo-(1,4)-beta-D-glucanase [Litchi chinensis]